MADLFITSTGTGIGKTFVTEQLLGFDFTHERRFCASKPIISGWPYQTAMIPETDTGRLLLAQKCPINSQTIENISPWRFHAPLAPSRAARVERQSIDVNALLTFCEQQSHIAQEQQKLHLIEGVGGIMVPLHDKWLVTDWMAALKCPSILVTGSYLGTISHTLSAIEALESRNIPLLAIVLSESVVSEVSLIETFETLQELLPSKPIILFPRDEKARNPCLEGLYTILLQYYNSTTMAAIPILA